jgi:exodeoxyribonuclease V alpha subunit
VFNGDIGRIVQIKPDGTTRIEFDDYREAVYLPDNLREVELAYAVTVHKSQGSEFDAVLLVLPEGRDRLSYRSLLYTAVTRAKKLLILIGSPRKVQEMVRDGHRTVRCSCLGAMLKAMVTKPASGTEGAEDT